MNNTSTDTIPPLVPWGKITTNYREKEENTLGKTFCYDLGQVVVPTVIILGIFLIVIFLI